MGMEPRCPTVHTLSARPNTWLHSCVVKHLLKAFYKTSETHRALYFQSSSWVPVSLLLPFLSPWNSSVRLVAVSVWISPSSTLPVRIILFPQGESPAAHRVIHSEFSLPSSCLCSVCAVCCVALPGLVHVCWEKCREKCKQRPCSPAAGWRAGPQVCNKGRKCCFLPWCVLEGGRLLSLCSSRVLSGGSWTMAVLWGKQLPIKNCDNLSICVTPHFENSSNASASIMKK